MANKYLSREDAPINAAIWETLDKTMLEAAKTILAGRRILHVDGPYGLGLKAVPLSDPPVERAAISSQVLPLALIHQTFSMSKRDLAAFEKDGVLLDTRGVAMAAMECARLEDSLIFNGSRETAGLMTAKGTNHVKLLSWDDVGAAANDVIKAITVLDGAGFHGPYALALSPARYNLLLRRYPQGNTTELEHIKNAVTEGIVKAPVLEGGGVLVAYGRQYATVVLGQDMAVGFVGPMGERLEFTVSESLTPYIKVSGAVCLLRE
jgi:uncharacterized linocin/CFP29 family protein